MFYQLSLKKNLLKETKKTRSDYWYIKKKSLFGFLIVFNYVWYYRNRWLTFTTNSKSTQECSKLFNPSTNFVFFKYISRSECKMVLTVYLLNSTKTPFVFTIWYSLMAQGVKWWAVYKNVFEWYEILCEAT